MPGCRTQRRAASAGKAILQAAIMVASTCLFIFRNHIVNTNLMESLSFIPSSIVQFFCLDEAKRGCVNNEEGTCLESTILLLREIFVLSPDNFCWHFLVKRIGVDCGRRKVVNEEFVWNDCS